MPFWSDWSWLGFGGSKRIPGTQRLEPGSGRLTKRIVTDDTALQLSAVFACVRLLAETVAGLPLDFYKLDSKGGKQLDTSHPLYRLLATKPNRYQTRVEFFETIIFQLGFRGNSYCAIERNAAGDIISLLPLMTAQVQVRLEVNGDLTYLYDSGKGLIVFAEQNIWHVKLFGNGITGLSPLDQARNSLGIAISGEDRVNKMANSGFKPTGVLTIDKLLTPEQRKALKENFKDLAEGGEDTLRVLEAGLTYQQISLSPKDAQLMDTRKFQIEEIARFFGVPSVLINDTSTSTVWGSGIGQIIIGWFKLGLRPYLERIKSSIVNRLLKVEERHTVCPEWDFDMLLRGDEAARYASYKVAISGGVLTPNECRKQEGLQAQPDGDKLFIDRQLIFLENGGLPNEQKTAPYTQAGAS